MRQSIQMSLIIESGNPQLNELLKEHRVQDWHTLEKKNNKNKQKIIDMST